MATAEQIARVLDEHRSKPTGSPYCTCQQHVAHQAEQVAALDEPTHYRAPSPSESDPA